MTDWETMVLLIVLGVGFLIMAAFYYWRDKRR